MTMDDIEKLRTKLRHHAWRRGMKEMDLIMGHYADCQLAKMDIDALLQFQTLMLRDDQSLYSILMNPIAPKPHDKDYELMMKLRKFIRNGGAVSF